jgi:hypothetical protein
VRLLGWADRLRNYLLAQQDTPFAYGSFDCLSFAAGAVEALTGINIMARFRGTYTTHLGAMRIAHRVYGCRTVPDVLAAMMQEQGWSEVPPTFAQRGDVVLVAINDDLVVGIMHPNGREAVITTNQGLWRVPLSSVRRAWKIQCLEASLAQSQAQASSPPVSHLT